MVFCPHRSNCGHVTRLDLQRLERHTLKAIFLASQGPLIYASYHMINVSIHSALTIGLSSQLEIWTSLLITMYNYKSSFTLNQWRPRRARTKFCLGHALNFAWPWGEQSSALLVSGCHSMCMLIIFAVHAGDCLPSGGRADSRESDADPSLLSPHTG